MNLAALSPYDRSATGDCLVASTGVLCYTVTSISVNTDGPDVSLSPAPFPLKLADKVTLGQYVE